MGGLSRGPIRTKPDQTDQPFCGVCTNGCPEFITHVRRSSVLKRREGDCEFEIYWNYVSVGIR